MKALRLCLLMLLLPLVGQAAELSIFAASSLSEGLKEAAEAYRHQQPQTHILLHFAGSQAIAAQIKQGAPADLFISANNRAMAGLSEAGLVEPPRLIARNRLVVATAAGLDSGVESLHDLTRPGLLLAVGNPQVPIGRYTRQLFERLALRPEYGKEMVAALGRNIVSQENQVKAIVAKLLIDEVDAGIVYQSDLRGTPLGSLPLPEEINPQASYPAAVVREGSRREARKFLNFLLGAQGQQILTSNGFQSAGGLP